MAEEEGRVNIMSVELAIQRELGHRKKVANLLSRSELNSLKDFATLQVTSSSQPVGPNPNPSPRPRPHQSSSTDIPSSSTCHMSLPQPHQVLNPGPTPVPNPSYPGPSLNTRQIPRSFPRLYSTSTRPRHFGIKRKATTSSHHRQPPPGPPPLPLPPQPRPRPPPQSGIISVDQHGIFFCKVCQVPCTGADSLKSHSKGQKHKAKLQMLQMGGNSDITTGQQGRQPRCELCGIWCSDQNGLEMHFKGQKHTAKVQEMESASKNGEEKSIERPWCELCQIWCMNEDALQQHLKGQKHIARLYSGQGY